MKIRNYVWLCSVEEELFYGIRPLRPTSWRKGGRSDSSGRLGLRRCFTTRNGYWSSHICVANFCDCLYFRDIFSYAICHGKFFVFSYVYCFFVILDLSGAESFLVGSGSGNTICVLVLFTTLPRLIAQESSNTDARQFLDPDPA